METDAQFTDALAAELFRLELRSLTTASVTAAITRSIVCLARGHGWRVRTEARVEVPLTSGIPQQLGYVDVLVSRGRPYPDVAIEIDSADKPWSVVKLRHAAAAGMHSIWVRWGDDAWAGVYADLDVIQLPTLRRSARRPQTPQMEMWRR